MTLRLLVWDVHISNLGFLCPRINYWCFSCYSSVDSTYDPEYLLFVFPVPQETKLMGLKSQITIPSPTSISTRCLQLPFFPSRSFWGCTPPRGWCRGHAWLRFRSWTWTIQGTVFVAESRKGGIKVGSVAKWPENSVFFLRPTKPGDHSKDLLNIKVFCYTKLLLEFTLQHGFVLEDGDVICDVILCRCDLIFIHFWFWFFKVYIYIYNLFWWDPYRSRGWV